MPLLCMSQKRRKIKKAEKIGYQSRKSAKALTKR
jgi:hypothetical protein